MNKSLDKLMESNKRLSARIELAIEKIESIHKEAPVAVANYRLIVSRQRAISELTLTARVVQALASLTAVILSIVFWLSWESVPPWGR